MAWTFCDVTIFEFVIVVMADAIVIIALIIMSFNPMYSKKMAIFSGFLN